MTTIHLTDAQRDTFAACGLIVIDGEPERCHGPIAHQDLQGGYCSACGWEWGKVGPRVAPERWRILTEPCDTCGGTGKMFRRNPYAPKYVDPTGLDDCSDCVGGRRVVTLTATCPDCSGTGIDGDESDWEPCPTCGIWDSQRGSGVVTLGRFVLTMRALDDGQFEITPERVA